MKSSPKNLKKLWAAVPLLVSHLTSYKKEIILLSVLGIISAIANGTVPFIMGKFLDSLQTLSKTFSLFDFTAPLWVCILTLWVVAQLTAGVLGWVLDYRANILRYSIQLGFQNKSFAFLLYLPLSFHKDTNASEIISLADRTSWQMAATADRSLSDFAPQVLSVLVGIGITLFIDPLFTLILLSGVFLYVIVLIKTVPATTALLERGHRAWNDVYSDAAQVSANVQTVKQMGAEHIEKKKLQRLFMGNLFSIWKQHSFVSSGINLYQRIIVLGTQVGIFLLSVYFISNGSLSIGDMVAVNGYAGLLFGPFITLGHSWQTVQNALTSVGLVEEKLFKHKHEVYLPINAYAPKEIEGVVEFSDVSFSYDKKAPVLKDISFKVAKGERVAFVGKSGVGKSTAIDLISAYYFATSGKVKIDGHDIKTFDLHSLRKHIAVVPQEPVLFNDSIAKNLSYVRPEATLEEIETAAKKAHIHDFIMSLPKKYKTMVGERGVKLSVGQKQRMAIARAILRDPAILILDEPTSALDAETERLITDTLEEIMKGKTTFIIAHRLSTVRKADNILVFEGGTIVENGSHDMLILKEGGVYKKLYEYQSGLH